MAEKIKPTGRLVASYGDTQVFLRDDGKYKVTGITKPFINLVEASLSAAKLDQTMQKPKKAKS